MRCAFTAPFHPFQYVFITIKNIFGGFLSVALVISSRSPGVTWHLALRSPDFPLFSFIKTKQRLFGQLQSTLYIFFKELSFFLF